VAQGTVDYIMVAIWITMRITIRIQEFFKVFFIYHCGSSRQPKTESENLWQRFELSECFLIMAARQLCWPPAILFYRCSLDLSFFRCLISEVAWLLATKVCRVFDSDPDL